MLKKAVIQTVGKYRNLFNQECGPVQHYLGSWIRIQIHITVKSWIRILIKAKIQELKRP
jgi:hypothetical protein